MPYMVSASNVEFGPSRGQGNKSTHPKGRISGANFALLIRQRQATAADSISAAPAQVAETKGAYKAMCLNCDPIVNVPKC